LFRPFLKAKAKKIAVLLPTFSPTQDYLVTAGMTQDASALAQPWTTKMTTPHETGSRRPGFGFGRPSLSLSPTPSCAAACPPHLLPARRPRFSPGARQNNRRRPAERGTILPLLGQRAGGVGKKRRQARSLPATLTAGRFDRRGRGQTRPVPSARRALIPFGHAQRRRKKFGGEAWQGENLIGSVFLPRAPLSPRCVARVFRGRRL